MRAKMLDFLGRRGKSEHEWVEESLSAYIDEELSVEEKTRVERHLHECQACTESLSTLQKTVALVRELPAVPAPRSFAVRPAPVRARPRITAPGWGYGLLKGATALAALLLVLLVGGDLTLQVLGGFPMAARAPLAPAAEVALAPSPMPSVIPAPADEEPVLEQGKAAEEWATEVSPSNAEEVPLPAQEPTEPPPAYAAPPAQDVASPAPGTEGRGSCDTPTAVGTPAEAEGIGVGGVEPTVITDATVPSSPAPEAAAPEQTVAPTPPAESEGDLVEAAPVSTPTPQPMAFAEVTEEERHERGELQPQVRLSPLAPLRLAESVVFILLVVFIAATVLTSWLIRRSG
jgi:hypothetical protein